MRGRVERAERAAGELARGMEEAERRAAALVVRLEQSARVHTSLSRLSAGVVTAARARLASARAALDLADGASLDAFEILERVGLHSNPAAAGKRCVLYP